MRETYLVVDVVCPCAAEKVLERAVVGWEFVFGEYVIRHDALVAQLSLFVDGGLEGVGMRVLVGGFC